MTTLAKYVLDLRKPHPPYHNAAGQRIVGTTTVCGVLEKRDLIDWAAREEREGIIRTFREAWGATATLAGLIALLPEERFHAIKRDKAADAGSLTHARIHAHFKGMELDEEGHDPDAVRQSLLGFTRFLSWWEAEKMQYIHSEHAMVSEAMQVGGTLDILADSPYGVTLVDVKTSKANPKSWPYDEHTAQVAGYGLIYREQPASLHISRACIYRPGKDETDKGGNTWLTTGQITAGEELFRAALACYRAKLALGRMK